MQLEGLKVVGQLWEASLASHALLGCLGVLILVLSILAREDWRRRLSRLVGALLVVLPGVFWVAAWMSSCPGRECGTLMGSGWGGAFFGWSIFVAPAVFIAGVRSGLWPGRRVGYRVTQHDLVIVFCALAIVVTVSDGVSI